MDVSPVTTSQYSLWGTSLKSVGASLIGGSVLTLPASMPAWLTVSLICVGLALQVVGNIFAHLSSAAVATQSNDTSFIVKNNVPTQTPLPASVAQSTPPTPKTT